MARNPNDVYDTGYQDPSQAGGNPPQPEQPQAPPQYTAEEQDFLKRNPNDQGRMKQALASQRTGGQPVMSGGSPVSSNGKIAPPVQYTPGTAPQGYKANTQAYSSIATPPAYKAGTVTQFQAPNHAAVNQGQLSLIEQILAHPQTLDDAAVAKLKESQKDSALAFARQQTEGSAGDFASRGVNGGQRVAYERMVNDALSSQLLGSYRDVDLAALATNRQDQLNALQASEQILGGQTDRATALYNALLSGQMSQESLNIEQVRSALEAAGFDLSKAQLTNEDLAREAQMALQRYQAEEDAKYRQSALSQGEWGTLLDEALRRDELNANDRYRYATLF